MSQLTKTQLEAVNQSNFPNNNTGFITPTLLRDFNTDIIDSMVDEVSYNIDSASFNSQISSSIASGSKVNVQGDGTPLGTVGTLNFSGSFDVEVVGQVATIGIVGGGGSGTSGTSGTAGTSGVSGTNGVNGTNGTSGVSGTSGQNGTSGTSGVSPTFDSGSYATTGSNSFVGNQTITGDLNVIGAITASVIYTQFETASVIFSSGSNQFGDAANDVQTLYGSVRVMNNLTASGLNYPSADNGAKSFIQSDGSGNLSLQYVESLYESIRNSESFTIAKGTPVYISGSTGANGNAFVADAGDSTKMPAIYITGEELTAGQTGLALAVGLIEGVNTTGFPAGTEIFVKQGGGYTSTRPTGSSAVIQKLGIVTKEGVGGQGVILNQLEAILPNIQEGYVWVGNSNSYPVAVATSSFAVDTSAFATTGSNTFTGEQIISSSLIVTDKVIGTGSLILKPDVNDPRFLEVYNTAAQDTHITASGGYLFLGDDTTYVFVNNFGSDRNAAIKADNGLAISGSTNITGSVDITGDYKVNGVPIPISPIATGSFATTGSNTFEGNQTINGDIIVTGSVETDRIYAQSPNPLDVDASGGVRLQMQGAVLEVSGSIQSNGVISSVSGFSGSGQNLTNVNAQTLNGKYDTDFATTGSNTFNGDQTVNNGYQLGTEKIVALPGNPLRIEANNDLQISGSTKIFGDLYIDGNLLNPVQIRQAAVDSRLVFNNPAATGYKFENGPVEIQGALTASLQQGYVWVGDGTGNSAPIATSSFTSTPIDSASFATTGSNVFFGDQFINGQLAVTSSGGAELKVNNDGSVDITSTIGVNVVGGQVVTGELKSNTNLRVSGSGTGGQAVWITKDVQNQNADFLIGEGWANGQGIELRQGSTPGGVFVNSALQMAGYSSSLIDIYANSGNYDTFRVVVGQNNQGVRLFDWNNNLGDYSNWLQVATNAGDITLKRNTQITGSLKVTGSVSANVETWTITSNTASIDLSKGNYFSGSLSGSVFFNIINPQPGQTAILKGVTAGAQTASFSSNVRQISGSAYVATSGSNETDILTLVTMDTSNVFLVSNKKFI